MKKLNKCSLKKDRLSYKILDYKEHILKPSHNIDELLSLVGEDEKQVMSFSDIDDVVAFSKELRSNA